VLAEQEVKMFQMTFNNCFHKVKFF